VAGELALEQVSFGYEPGQPVLRELSLQVKPGQVVALVGPSGGRATPFSLLLRFNTAQSGRAPPDGRDLADLRASELRKAVALVPQQSAVFSGTVADAIAFGRPASLEAEPARRRGWPSADGFIEALPEGYARRGWRSGAGSLRRPAAAPGHRPGPCWAIRPCCCWIRPPAPWMPKSEQAVQRGLDQAMAGPHRAGDRPPALHRAGGRSIVVLEQGRIVDQGNHDLLISRPGRYRDLCERPDPGT
jgi:ATP-binding cassette subfamily B protein